MNPPTLQELALGASLRHYADAAPQTPRARAVLERFLFRMVANKKLHEIPPACLTEAVCVEAVRRDVRDSFKVPLKHRRRALLGAILQHIRADKTLLGNTRLNYLAVCSRSLTVRDIQSLEECCASSWGMFSQRSRLFSQCSLLIGRLQPETEQYVLLKLSLQAGLWTVEGKKRVWELPPAAFTQQILNNLAHLQPSLYLQLRPECWNAQSNQLFFKNCRTNKGLICSDYPHFFEITREHPVLAAEAWKYKGPTPEYERRRCPGWLPHLPWDLRVEDLVTQSIQDAQLPCSRYTYADLRAINLALLLYHNRDRYKAAHDRLSWFLWTQYRSELAYKEEACFGVVQARSVRRAIFRRGGHRDLVSLVASMQRPEDQFLNYLRAGSLRWEHVPAAHRTPRLVNWAASHASE